VDENSASQRPDSLYSGVFGWLIVIPEEMKSLIERWFGAATCAGLVFPDGWFGRPYDSFYTLRNVTINDGSLNICLDEGLSITFADPGRVWVNKSELIFDGFKNLRFTWGEGGGKIHEEKYDSGSVRFVPPVGTIVTIA
jgi:hypothetical protein